MAGEDAVERPYVPSPFRNCMRTTTLYLTRACTNRFRTVPVACVYDYSGLGQCTKSVRFFTSKKHAL